VGLQRRREECDDEKGEESDGDSDSDYVPTESENSEVEEEQKEPESEESGDQDSSVSAVVLNEENSSHEVAAAVKGQFKFGMPR